MSGQGKSSEPTPPRGFALVTGASAGIGATFARKLAGRGYGLILVARRAKKLAELAAELSGEHGIEAEALPADLADDAGLAMVVERIRNCENLEFLVNNAGFGLVGLFGESDLQSQQAMARLGVLATTNLTHAALGGMVERGRGFIINVSSVAAFFHSPGNVMYNSTKAWMNSFTHGLALELRGTGVKVQALCPGFTLSEFHDVMGVDRKAVPKAWWLGAEYVVDYSLRDLGRGRVISIPAARYKLAVLLSKLLPGKLLDHNAEKRHEHVKKYFSNPKR